MPDKLDLKVKLGGMELQNPVMTASGTFGYAREFKDLIDLNRLGAIIVKDDMIIGRGYNRVESLKDPTAHAEIIAISAACNTIKNWRLNGSKLYVTVEPCMMCGGAILHSRIEKVVYSVKEPKFGSFGTVTDILKNNKCSIPKKYLHL